MPPEYIFEASDHKKWPQVSDKMPKYDLTEAQGKWMQKLSLYLEIFILSHTFWTWCSFYPSNISYFQSSIDVAAPFQSPYMS